MLVVKVELHPPFGEVKLLGEAHIYNTTGQGRGRWDKRADYGVRVLRRGGGKAYRTGTVVDYPRLSYNVWRLVIRALLGCFHEEVGYVPPGTKKQ